MLAPIELSVTARSLTGYESSFFLSCFVCNLVTINRTLHLRASFVDALLCQKTWRIVFIVPCFSSPSDESTTPSRPSQFVSVLAHLLFSLPTHVSSDSISSRLSQHPFCPHLTHLISCTWLISSNRSLPLRHLHRLACLHPTRPLERQPPTIRIAYRQTTAFSMTSLVSIPSATPAPHHLTMQDPHYPISILCPRTTASWKAYSISTTRSSRSLQTGWSMSTNGLRWTVSS